MPKISAASAFLAFSQLPVGHTSMISFYKLPDKNSQKIPVLASFGSSMLYTLFSSYNRVFDDTALFK